MRAVCPRKCLAQYLGQVRENFIDGDRTRLNLEGAVRIKVTEKWRRFPPPKNDSLQKPKEMEDMASLRPEAPSIVCPVIKVRVVWRCPVMRACSALGSMFSVVRTVLRPHVPGDSAGQNRGRTWVRNRRHRFRVWLPLSA